MNQKRPFSGPGDIIYIIPMILRMRMESQLDFKANDVSGKPR